MIARIIALLVLAAATAFAHEGEPVEPHDLWTAWTWAPGIIIPLLLSAVLYYRGAKASRGMRRWEIACFWAGWVTLVIALVSPLHPLGEALFSAHMAQHELLMVIAAPLLVLGRPLVPMLWALPMGLRQDLGRFSKTAPVQRSWRFLTGAAVAWIVHAVVLWGWHAPALFQATLTSDFVHSLQHISFLGSALLFWWALFHARTHGTGVLYIFTTTVHTGALGALLTFSGTLWYPAYAPRTAAWGFTPIEDQQLGGLIMWVPASISYVVAGLWLMARWIRESEAQVLRREGEVEA
jgi:putative membrane protein